MRELSDRWVLDVKGERVVRASVREVVCSVRLTGGVEIEGIVRVLDATEVAPVDAAPMTPDRMEALLGKEVASAVAFKDGSLRVVFKPGYQLQAVPDGSAVIRVRQADVFEWTGTRGAGEMLLLEGDAMGGTEWVLEEFDRRSGRLAGRHRLTGLADGEALSLLGLTDLGDGDLFDISDASLAELSNRFGLTVSPKEFEYLLGRESSGRP